MLSNFDPTKGRNQDVASCDKCKVTWFETVQVTQFKTDYTCIIGQTPPMANDFKFVFLRCLGCGEKYEPNIIHGGMRTKETKLYDDLLDSLDKANPAKDEPVLPETK